MRRVAASGAEAPASTRAARCIGSCHNRPETPAAPLSEQKILDAALALERELKFDVRPVGLEAG